LGQIWVLLWQYWKKTQDLEIGPRTAGHTPVPVVDGQGHHSWKMAFPNGSQNNLGLQGENPVIGPVLRNFPGL
jgi:hypothetical protein